MNPLSYELAHLDALEASSIHTFREVAAEFEARIKDLAMPVEFGLENMNYFIDWTKNSPFEVIRGEGECAV